MRIGRTAWRAWLGLVVALAIAWASPAAHAQSFEELVTALATGGFSDKEKAVDGLATLGDPRAVPVLQALADGKLSVASDQRVLVVDGTSAKDAVTGAALPAGDYDRVRVNNRLRGAIASALSQLMLFSPNPADRLAAATDAVRHPTAESAAALTKALATEKDASVKEAMQFALSAAQVNAGTNEEKLAAVKRLSGSLDPQVRSLLSQIQGAADANPELRAAATAALAASEQRLQMITVAQTIFQGVSLGSVLLLAAIGLAITFGVMGVINMAHGEMIMLGAYSAYVVQEAFRAFLPPGLFGWYLIAAVPVAFVVAGAVGIVLERTVIRFLYGRALETLLATWGISLVLQQAVRMVFGAPNKEVSNPEWMTGGFIVAGGFDITWNRLVIIVFCFVVLGILMLIIQRTSFGLHMRAVTQNRDMASAMGIPTARVDAFTFGLGSGIAGMAGVALSQVGNVSPNLGTIYIVDSFMVVVFGGVGNLLGTLVGAMGLGIVNKVLEPVAGAVLGKVVVLVAIILFIQRRPRGLFALKGRMAEA